MEREKREKREREKGEREKKRELFSYYFVSSHAVFMAAPPTLSY
jgi:hypothetical protein